MYDKKFNNRAFNIFMFIKQIEIQKKKRSVKYTTTNYTVGTIIQI